MFQKYGQHDQSFICDTINDLQYLPKANMGSTCWVIETAEKYMINSKGIWILQTRSTNGTENIDLSKYATIQYSDTEDDKLRTYSDQQDEYILSQVDDIAIEVINNAEIKPAWEDMGASI